LGVFAGLALAGGAAELATILALVLAVGGVALLVGIGSSGTAAE